MTATIWRTCPSCGMRFEQPDDPGRKRVYCSRACQQAAYRARQHQHRAAAGQAGPAGAAGGSQHTGASRQRPGDDQRQQRRTRTDSGTGQRGHRPGPRPGASSNGHNGYRTDTAEQARVRRIIDALLRKAASTTFPAEADACRAKAEQLRIKHGL